MTRTKNVTKCVHIHCIVEINWNIRFVEILLDFEKEQIFGVF